MADSKKYDGSTWEHSLRKLTTATEAVENPLYSDGTAITAYTLKGNTVQNGTPTPSNPVSVTGVGDKTANSFDVNGETDVKATSITIINNAIKFENVSSGNTARITYSAQYAAGTYYISCVASGSNYSGVRLFSNSSFTGATYNSFYGGYYRDFTASGFSTSLTFDNDFKIGFIANAAGGATFTIYDIMLSTTEADYEPYGIKIPISNGQASAVNYLGSVQSYREIKKIEYTGAADESWTITNSGTANAYVQNLDNPAAIQGVDKLICTHYQAGEIYNGNTDTGILVVSNGGVRIRDTNAASMSVSSFKTWLQQQYANGTPVTVWYVLATPETAAVNEPLMKIGDYSDSISNATPIPTTEGANSITVDTTVQPSEFTATWTGWHNASVQEYTGGVGNNKFDEQYPDISDTIIYKPIYVGDGNFTLSTTAPQTSDPAALLFLLSGNVSSGASSSANGVWSGQNRTKAAVDGYVTIAYRAIRDYTPVGSQTMLNAGTTAMTYEPYEYGWV